MEEGQNVVRAVSGVDAVLLEEVTVPKYSLPEVAFAALLDVSFVERNEIVPVWPRVLMNKTYTIGGLNCSLTLPNTSPYINLLG